MSNKAKIIFFILIFLLCILGCDKDIVIKTFPVADDYECWCYPRADRQNTGYISGNLNDDLEILWEKDIKYLDPSSAIIFADMLIIGLRTKRILAFDTQTGNKVGDIWVDVPLIYPPIVYDNKLWYLGFGDWNKVGVYNLKNRKIEWSRSCGDAEVFPIITDSPTQSLIVATLKGGIYALALHDAEKKWTYKTPLSIKEPGAYHDGIIYFCSGNKIFAIDGDGELVWQKKIPIAPAGVLVVYGEKIFAHSSNGKILALSTEHGEIIWENSIGEGGLPMATDGKKLIVPERTGKVFGLDNSTGEKIWSSQIGDVLTSAPSIVGNKVILITYTGKLFLLNIENGKTITTLDIDVPVRRAPISDGEKIFVISMSGKLFCIR
ncbi:hypothetical protein DRQ33_07760 [bacterium]|nr:MAG: hypothetical protein DRQ33_07760 [bacterium]